MPTRRLSLFALPAVLLALAQGCADAPAETLDALDARVQAIFPTSAPHLLAATDSPEAAATKTAEGFAIRGPRASAARGLASSGASIEAALPLRGDGVLRLRLPGFEVRVTEEGLTGEGRIRGGAVLYPRAAGASFFRRGPAGCEEWVFLEDGTGAGDSPVAVWHVEGARLAQRGAEVTLKDETGEDRMVVRAPLGFTKVGMPIPLRLEARGQDVLLFAHPIKEPVLIDPEWLPAAPMNTSRYGHDAVRLQDGRVLVTGESATGDVYDEAKDKWTATGPLVHTHFHGTATLLADGRVLVTGGIDPATLAEAEIYDPATNQWTATGSMSTPRWYHKATLLPNSKVLVEGGQTGVAAMYLTSAELYDPKTGTWTATGSMATGRSEHFAALLPNGKVIVGGGVLSAKQTELYDPGAGTWKPAASMVTDHFNQPAPALLPDGTLLVTCANVVSGDVGRYDPIADVWSMAGTIAQPRIYCTATALPSGAALVAGGYFNTYFAEAERYNPASKMWSVIKPMTQARSEHTATLLPSGGVLMAGGFDGMSFLTSAEIYEDGAVKGAPCVMDTDCTSGSCVSGVCCDSACQGPCQACTAALGAPNDGTCGPISGPCPGGMCQGGQCMGSSGSSGSGSSGSGSSGSGSSDASSSSAGSGGGGGEGGAGGGGGVGDHGGCGCEVAGARGAGGVWVAMGLLLAAWRRRARGSVVAE